MMRAKAVWRTWDEPDRQVAVASWVERDIAVVFPLRWASKHGQRQMIARAKERIAEVESKLEGSPVERFLERGSVLLAFSEHEPQPALQMLAAETPRSLI